MPLCADAVFCGGPCRQLTIIEALLVGGAEVYRNTELAPEKRIYPGGVSTHSS